MSARRSDNRRSERAALALVLAPLLALLNPGAAQADKGLRSALAPSSERALRPMFRLSSAWLGSDLPQAFGQPDAPATRGLLAAADTMTPAPTPAGCPPCICEACSVADDGTMVAPTGDYNVFTTNVDWTNYLLPIPIIIGENIGMWLPVRIAGADYAEIDFSTIATNFSVGWEWDRDTFSTNQFRHPYQGSLYFSTARAYGLSYWEALPYTVFGSWQWEMFMENELPSFNDIITTSFGGFFVGEALWRLSNATLDDSTRGVERVLREIGGFVLNPVNGIARLINGKSWQSGPAPDHPTINGTMKFGLTSWGGTDLEDRQRLFRIRLDLKYSDVLGGVDLTTPFTNFEIRLAFNFDADAIPGRNFGGTGLLYGWSLPLGESTPSVLGIYQDFGYLVQPILTLGNSSVGVGWDGRLDITENTYFRWKWHMFFSFLTAVDSVHAPELVDREYGLGPGYHSRIELRLAHSRWGHIELETARYMVYIASGAQGWESIGAFSVEAYVHLLAGVGISAEFAMFDKESLLQDFANTSATYDGLAVQIVSQF